MSAPSGRHVRIAQNIDRYLQSIDSLPEIKRRQVIDECVRDLSNDADHFALRYPVAHESYCFTYEYALIHERVVYAFTFYASSEYFAMGVVDVLYVELEKLEGP